MTTKAAFFDLSNMMSSQLAETQLRYAQRVGHSRATWRQCLQTCVMIMEIGAVQGRGVPPRLLKASSSTMYVKIVVRISGGSQDIQEKVILRERRPRKDSASAALSLSVWLRVTQQCSMTADPILGIISREVESAIVDDLRGNQPNLYEVSARKNYLLFTPSREMDKLQRVLGRIASGK